MDLREYLYQKRMKIKDFSQILEYDRSQVTQVIGGKRKPGRKMIMRIERATEGLVTKEDLLKNYKDKNSSEENDSFNFIADKSIND